MVELTLEQQFEYKTWLDAVEKMSRVQAVHNLKEAQKQFIIKSNIIKSLMNNSPLTKETYEMSFNQFQDYKEQTKDYDDMNRKVAIESLLEKLTHLIDKDNTIKSLMKKTMFL